MRNEVAGAVDDAIQYAKRRPTDHPAQFLPQLERSRQILSGAVSVSREDFPDSVPSPLGLAIYQGAMSAWVFGGMGWWNDYSAPAEDGGEFERVSEALLTAIDDAVELVANSTFANN